MKEEADADEEISDDEQLKRDINSFDPMIPQKFELYQNLHMISGEPITPISE